MITATELEKLIAAHKADGSPTEMNANRVVTTAQQALAKFPGDAT